MKRLFSFILRLVVLVALAVWLADRPGDARIVWHGYVIETSAAFLGFCVLALGFVLYLLFRAWNFLRNGPAMWKLRRTLRKLRDGQKHLTEGLVAVAAGNAAEAGRKALAARKLLGVTPATRLLQAQAAQLAGDGASAREIFLALAAEPESAVLGYRGLIMESLRARDWEEVDRLAEKLRRLRPETPWLNVIRFELAARRQNWDEARTALEAAGTARLVESSRAKRHQAALLVAMGQDEARLGNAEKSLQAAERAMRLAPDWLPAVLLLARQQMAAGHKRAGLRTVERAWVRHPHPQLATALRTNEEPLEAYKQIEKLVRGTEDNPASRLVLAEAALDADIWGEARRYLMALMGSGAATRKAYRLLARLERRETGRETEALQWLTRAADAPLDPQWVCRSCGGAQEEWQALCRYCRAFNSLDWQSPGESRSVAEISSGALLANWAE